MKKQSAQQQTHRHFNTHPMELKNAPLLMKASTMKRREILPVGLRSGTLFSCYFCPPATIFEQYNKAPLSELLAMQHTGWPPQCHRRGHCSIAASLPATTARHRWILLKRDLGVSCCLRAGMCTHQCRSIPTPFPSSFHSHSPSPLRSPLGQLVGDKHTLGHLEQPEGANRRP